MRTNKGRRAAASQRSAKPRTRAPRRVRETKRQVARRAASSRGDEPSSVANVRITHPDRVIYPREGITKLDLARFYERIADWILPHLEGRPLTLVRCPEGIGTECFYMKHSKVWAPPGVRRVNIQEKTKVGEYLVADTVTALVGLVQMGILEIHTWNSRDHQIEQPDRLVLDLDPGPEVPWSWVIEAARLVRRVLERAGLESFPKTTGGRGLHVVVPLAPSADWQTCLEFSRTIATILEQHDSSRYTTAFAKAGRERKILVDYLRNNRTNTSVAAYSTRARPGAPVSVPLRWSELVPSLDPASLTVLNIEQRLARLRSDPWAGYFASRQPLPR